ncbi:MAG: DUF1289 domain-containing protein [Pseudomonadota bacterium]
MTEISTADENSRLRSRATPCVGICSTTYGDLVCRGCKRFAHEITGWNGYSGPQRDEIELRLATLVAGALERFVIIMDRDTCAAQVGAESSERPWLERALYRALRMPARSAALTAALQDHQVLRLRSPLAGTDPLAALAQSIESEFLARSKAAYERSFKVNVD